MDEARTVIRRLERIEALQSEEAPAAVLLTEVRLLLREGEAWLAAERSGAGGLRDVGDSRSGPAGRRPEDAAGTTDQAAAALADCRERLRDGGEVTAQAVENASL